MLIEQDLLWTGVRLLKLFNQILEFMRKHEEHFENDNLLKNCFRF